MIITTLKLYTCLSIFFLTKISSQKSWSKFTLKTTQKPGISCNWGLTDLNFNIRFEFVFLSSRYRSRHFLTLDEFNMQLGKQILDIYAF